MLLARRVPNKKDLREHKVAENELSWILYSIELQ
jgi:hypothetical protein